MLVRKTRITSSATPRLPSESASAHMQSTYFEVRVCHSPWYVSSLVGTFALYFNTYTSILAQASVIIDKKRALCVVCSVLCGVFHVPHALHSVAAPEFLNCPGILGSKTCNNVSCGCLVDVHHLSPSILFKTTSRVASMMLTEAYNYCAATLNS